MPDEPQTIPTVAPSHKLAAMRLGIGLIKAEGTYIIGALMGIDWHEMTKQQQFLIVVAGVVALANHVEAFNDKTMSRLADGQAQAKAKKDGTTPPMQIPPT